MNKNNKLMVSFVKEYKIKDFLDYIHRNSLSDRIFVLKSLKQKNIFICTYNIDTNINMVDLIKVGATNTFKCMRNSETNTIYSLNALNSIIKANKNAKLEWNTYKNNVLLINSEKLNIMPTKLIKIILIKKGFDINKVSIANGRKVNIKAERYPIKKFLKKEDSYKSSNKVNAIRHKQ